MIEICRDVYGCGKQNLENSRTYLYIKERKTRIERKKKIK